MRVAIAGDHAGYEMKAQIHQMLCECGHEVADFGAFVYDAEDDYPDFVIPLAQNVASGARDRGVCICGTGIGAAIAANKVCGARAVELADLVLVRTVVEDNDANVLCIGSRLIELELVRKLVQTFLDANFNCKPRRERQLKEIEAIEQDKSMEVSRRQKTRGHPSVPEHIENAAAWRVARGRGSSH